MGMENLFHKRRKVRESSSLKRGRYASREPNKRIFIICEDEKSSRYYFEGFCQDNNLERDVKVEKCPNGNDPLTMVAYAKTQKNYYQKIYCVFDADVKLISEKNGKRYQDALNKCKGSGGHIIAIDSMPSFEYWLLLHHVFHLAPFEATEKHTIDDMVVRELEKYMPDYDKRDKDIYTKTKIFLDRAMRRADAVEIEQRRVQSDNPSTKIHRLIRDLENWVKLKN
jgi:hypothetical protein